MKFYLLIESTRLSAYNVNREPEYIDGNPYVEYEPQQIKSAIGELIDGLRTNYNLDERSPLNFVVVKSRDELINSVVVDELSLRASVETIELDGLLKRALANLSKDRSLRIDELGVNCDDRSYFLRNGNLIDDEYSLTAYTMPSGKLLELI